MNRWWKIGNLSPLIKKASVLDQSIDPNLKRLLRVTPAFVPLGTDLSLFV